MDPQVEKEFQEYQSNIKQFYMASNFQKMILSMIVGMRKQKEELLNIKKIFQLIDTDKDGTLSMDEIRQGLANNHLFELLRKDFSQSVGNSAINDEFELIIEALDTDKDGKIDYNEFL